MIQYKWVINQINCVPKEGNLKDIVSNIYYVRAASQNIDNKLIFASILGIMSCSTPNETDFTPYENLTYEQVCSWLEDGLNVYEIDNNLDSQIQNIINPPIVTLPLPFENPTN